MSFAVGGEASETGNLVGEEASDAAAGDRERAWSGGSASTGAAGDSSRAAARGGVRVGQKGVGIVVAAAKHAGELVAQWMLLWRGKACQLGFGSRATSGCAGSSPPCRSRL